MICDDSMRFLEIAEVIHSLKLTILHGVMEKRSGNTWAHYIVEAWTFFNFDFFFQVVIYPETFGPTSPRVHGSAPFYLKRTEFKWVQLEGAKWTGQMGWEMCQLTQNTFCSYSTKSSCAEYDKNIITIKLY